MATPHTLLVNYAELQNQRVGCVRYARSCLIDSLPFQQSFKTLKQQTIPSPTPKPQTKILWRVIAETSLSTAHSFLPSNSPTQNRTYLSNISTCCVRLIWMCKNNIPLKPSPYAYCRTIFTLFGRCRLTMRIIPCAGG